MFNPTRDQARRFFIEAWRKHLAKEVVSPLEDAAIRLVVVPEVFAGAEDLNLRSRHQFGEDASRKLGEQVETLQPLRQFLLAWLAGRQRRMPLDATKDATWQVYGKILVAA